MFIIPLGTMVTAYMLIFCTIAKKSRDLAKGKDAISYGNVKVKERVGVFRLEMRC